MLANVVCVAMFIASFVHGSRGYGIEIEPRGSISAIPEGTSKTAFLYLTNCSQEVTSVSITLVESGPFEYADYPGLVQNVTCCNSTHASTSCGAPIDFQGKFLGELELKLCDTNIADNCIDSYLVGVIRPPKQLKDDVFYYGLITGIIINTTCFGALLDLSKVKKYLRKPVAPIIGACCQFIMMPTIGYLITLATSRPTSIEFGLFAAAVSPGGGGSNVWSFLLGGDIDLSITMTFISTIFAIAFIPLWMYTLGAYMLRETNIELPFSRMATSLAYVAIPVCVGLLINRFLPKLAEVLRKFQRVFIPIFILFLLTMGTYSNLYAYTTVFTDYQIALSGMMLPYIGGILSLIVACICRMDRSLMITIALETAFQNSSIAIVILRSVLPQPWGDISSALPISLNIFTPWPLYILVIIRVIYKKCYKKENFFPEKKKDDEEHSADMDKESIGDDDDKDGMVNDGYDKEPVDLKTTNL